MVVVEWLGAIGFLLLFPLFTIGLVRWIAMVMVRLGGGDP